MNTSKSELGYELFFAYTTMQFCFVHLQSISTTQAKRFTKFRERKGRSQVVFRKPS